MKRTLRSFAVRVYVPSDDPAKSMDSRVSGNPKRRGGKAIRIAAILAFAAFTAGMSGKPAAPGGPAPAVSLEDLSGKTVSLSDYRGRHVLLHFWATWCKPCVKELPEIEAAYRDFRDQGFVVLGIDVGEERETVRAFVEQFGLSFPVLLDRDSAIAADYNIIGLPVSFFIDRDGVIRGQITGGTLTRELIAARLGGNTSGALPHEH